MSCNFSEPQVIRTEAHHIQPGQYRYDSDFSLSNSSRSATVPKGYLTDSVRAARFAFPGDARTNKHGIEECHESR